MTTPSTRGLGHFVNLPFLEKRQLAVSVVRVMESPQVQRTRIGTMNRRSRREKALTFGQGEVSLLTSAPTQRCMERPGPNTPWKSDSKGVGQAGFSLLEVMCAILILGVAMAGLTHGITTALGSSKEAELQTAAALLAAGKIETLRAESYLTDGETEGEWGESLSLYRWRQTISNTPIDGLHEVTVVIENSKGGQAIYELKTLLFDPSSTSIQNQAGKLRDLAESRSRERRRR